MSTGRSLFDSLDNALDPIWDRVALHQRIATCVDKVLPHAVRQHLKIGCVQGDTLIVFCDTPAWASDIRYRESLIVQSVKTSERLEITRCRVLVRAELFHPS